MSGASKIQDRGAGRRPRFSGLIKIARETRRPACCPVCIRLVRSAVRGSIGRRESRERIRRCEPDDAITNVNAPRPDVPLPRRLTLSLFVGSTVTPPRMRVRSRVIADIYSSRRRRSNLHRARRVGYFRELMQLMRRLTGRILARVAPIEKRIDVCKLGSGYTRNSIVNITNPADPKQVDLHGRI